MDLTKKDSRSLLEEVEQLAFEAGTKLLRYEKKIRNIRVNTKESLGVVSEADESSEAFILKRLEKLNHHFGLEASFLAEEQSYQERGSNGKEDQEQRGLQWIIDPLDGTNNFLAGLNYYAVCICLAEGKTPYLGVVYRPSTGECFSALKNEGPWKRSFSNNEWGKRKRLTPSPTDQMSQALFSTGFSTEKGEVFLQEFELFRQMMAKTRGIRRMGSAALDLCYVASGIFEGFWERGLSPWDTAAAGLICQEAGVKVSNYLGEPFHPFQSTIMATTPSLYSSTLQVMKNFH